MDNEGVLLLATLVVPHRSRPGWLRIGTGAVNESAVFDVLFNRQINRRFGQRETLLPGILHQGD